MTWFKILLTVDVLNECKAKVSQSVFYSFNVPERNILKWFARFKGVDFKFKDHEHQGTFFTTDEDQIKILNENNLR